MKMDPDIPLVIPRWSPADPQVIHAASNTIVYQLLPGAAQEAERSQAYRLEASAKKMGDDKNHGKMLIQLTTLGI